MFAGVCVALLGFALEARAENSFSEVATYEVQLEPKEAKRGETVTWKFTMHVKDGWHTYPTKAKQFPGNPSVTGLRFPKPGEEVLFVGELTEPESRSELIDGTPTLVVEGTAVWERKLLVRPDAKPGKVKVEVKSNLLACTTSCLFDSPILTSELTVTDGPPVEVDPKYKQEYEQATKASDPPSPRDSSANGTSPKNDSPKNDTPKNDTPSVPFKGSESKGSVVVPPAASLEEHLANIQKLRSEMVSEAKPQADSGLWSFLLTAALWGALTLVTPCVFPMIPITVSYFLKQSEKEHHRPLQTAIIYCGTIIVVLSVAAWALLKVFRAMSVNPFTNLAMGALFIVFALSLFGLFELVLPQRISRFTSSREGRSGWIGTVFMALTFTVVSFSCVAPFLGGFGGTTSAGHSDAVQILGALVFATVFAAPFFILALFPSLIKKLPKSGSWLTSVKVVMGFLELAAALKFLRMAELGWSSIPSFFTYDVVMGIWVAIAIVCGLYLLNIVRIGHDDPEQSVGVVRALLGVAFIALGIYLAPALFKNSKGDNQRPAGVLYAWIDSFLLPEPKESDLAWSANLYGTVLEARKELQSTGKPQYIFVDHTGVTCTNCKYNEQTVFSRSEVRQLFSNYKLVQLYTDWVPANFYPQEVSEERRYGEAQANLKEFQRPSFGTEQLPLYVLLEVTKDKIIVRGQYEAGKINDVSAFVKFLQQGLESNKTLGQQASR
jgi:thiol:disulfide interchange protein DsbD